MAKDLITLRGHYAGRDWEMQVFPGPVTCNVCDLVVDLADPDTCWKVHSASPVCSMCVAEYRVSH